MRRLLACLVLAGFVGPAVACINDIELPTHEREFRSQYRGPASPLLNPSSAPTDPPGYRLLIAAGATLLTGAVALAVTGGRRRG